MDETERIINIPLRATKMAPRTKRAKRAIKEIRENIVRHMKVAEDKVWIDTALNEKIWERGIQNPPSRITVKAVKFDDGLVEVSLPEKKKGSDLKKDEAPKVSPKKETPKEAPKKAETPEEVPEEPSEEDPISEEEDLISEDDDPAPEEE